MLNLSFSRTEFLLSKTYIFHDSHFSISFFTCLFLSHTLFFLIILQIFQTFSIFEQKARNATYSLQLPCPFKEWKRRIGEERKRERKKCTNICNMFADLKWPLEFFIHLIWWKTQCSVERFSMCTYTYNISFRWKVEFMF